MTEPFDSFQLPSELRKLLSGREQQSLKDKILEIHIRLKKRDPELDDRRSEGYHLWQVFDDIAIRLQHQPNFKEHLVPNVIPEFIEQIRSDLSWYPHNCGDLRPYFLAASITEWRNRASRLVDQERGVAHGPENLSGLVRAGRDLGRSEAEHENGGLTAVVANADVESGQELAVDRVAQSKLPVSITCGQREFRKTGETWFLYFDGLTVTITHRLGMTYIGELLRSPRRSLSCLALQASVGRNPDDRVPEKDLEGQSVIAGFQAEEILDKTAVKQYRDRLDSIDTELLEAERNRDTGRREKLAAEKEVLVGQLKSVTGLLGRPRRFATDAEKARKAVSSGIKRALRRIKQHHPALAKHLREHIKLGISCHYKGDDVSWDF